VLDPVQKRLHPTNHKTTTTGNRKTRKILRFTNNPLHVLFNQEWFGFGVSRMIEKV
jgi:hypothetical protein